MPNNKDFLMSMKQHFLLGGMDPDLLGVAERAVPPGDLKAIGLCRLVFGSIKVSIIFWFFPHKRLLFHIVSMRL